MIDMEMWFLWCKGVVFGMILATIIREFGSWVRSRRTQRALDDAYCSCEGYWFQRDNPTRCGLCGKPHRQ